LKEEKLKQLRIVFKNLLDEMIKEIKEGSNVVRFVTKSEFYTNRLLYEVKIRINNK